MKKKIVMTGGHAGSTALAVIEQIRVEKREWEVYWVGAKRAFEDSNVETFEQKVFPDMGVKTRNLSAGRLQRRWSIHTIPSLLKVPIGIWQAFFVLLSIRPSVILSFGGFAGFPVVLAGFVLRIPIIIHEQTAAIGLGNRLSIPFANSIAIARKSSIRHFPKKKTVLVGNPLRRNILNLETHKNKKGKMMIFVTGGSRGARAINNSVEQDLNDLLEKYELVHQTGEIEYQKFLEIKKRLPRHLRSAYFVYSFLDVKRMSEMLGKAEVVVSRAGANTVSELLYLGKRMVLIPIPWTRYDEQNKNAALAVKYGGALVIQQNNLKKGILVDSIVKAMRYDKRKTRKDIVHLDSKAAESMTSILAKYV